MRVRKPHVVCPGETGVIDVVNERVVPHPMLEGEEANEEENDDSDSNQSVLCDFDELVSNIVNKGEVEFLKNNGSQNGILARQER